MHFRQEQELLEDGDKNYAHLFQLLQDCEECEFDAGQILGMEVGLCIAEHRHWEVFTCQFVSGCSVLMDDKTDLVNHILEDHFKVSHRWIPKYEEKENGRRPESNCCSPPALFSQGESSRFQEGYNDLEIGRRGEHK